MEPIPPPQPRSPYFGMAWRAESLDRTCDDAVARIVGAVNPWRVVLFGSRARGTPHEHSDYDFYVEVDAAGSALAEIQERVRRLAWGDGLTVDLKVHPRGEIERRRDDPGTVEWDVAREGRVLYADPAAPATLAPPARARERSRRAPKSVREWLDAAERDVEAAEQLRAQEARFAPTICWLSQQASEKFLKALLVARWVRPSRTHKLTELLAALRHSGCALPGLDEDCELLTTHAITPRYPAGNGLGVDASKAASAAAARVIAAVRAELPESPA